MQTLTFIAPFEVPEGQEETLRQQWHEAAERLSHAEGFLSARLYEISAEVEDYIQHIPGMDWVGKGKRFRFVDIAEWASLALFEAALRSFHDLKPIVFPSYPAYYRVYGGSGSSADSIRPPRTGQEFTFVVPFEVPEGQEDVMRQQWNDIIRSMAKEGGRPVEGSFGPGLYEIDTEAEDHMRRFLSAGTGDEPAGSTKFRFVNVAAWASLAHYEAVLRSRRPVKPIAFPGYGAYYRIVAEYTGHKS